MYIDVHLEVLFFCYRDIKDTTVGSLSQRITNQLQGLRGLHSQLTDIGKYLTEVGNGSLPINHAVIYQLQDVFNLLPDINLQEFVKAMYVNTNDQHLVLYLSALIRSTIALHNLINNKIQNRDAEKNENAKKDEKKKEDKEKDKDKDSKEGKGDAKDKKEDSKDKDKKEAAAKK